LNAQAGVSLPGAMRQCARAQRVDAAALASLRDWFPAALDGDRLAWRHVPGRFADPFFADTLQRQAPHERRVCFTPLSALARAEPGLAPSAFVFHISRCGSTLLTQLLATLPACVSLSEPPVIDDFLRLHRQAPHASGGIPRLRQLILALGQRRQPAETHYIIKFDSWHLCDLDLLRAAFPDTPCWFLYREPEAVLASHRRMRGPHMTPGLVLPAQPGEHAVAPGDLEGYGMEVLALYFRLALSHASHLRWLHYRQLPAAVWDIFLPHAGLACREHEVQAMRLRAAYHAKDGAAAYRGDPPAPGAQAGMARLAALYAQVETLRLAQDAAP
jgi:hypothetical protein